MRAALERAGKVRLHAQLASDPRAHAWTLSLYRAGERHPETVDDYFPVERARERWPELAASMKRHAGDERGHAALYAKAIERSGQAVLDIDPGDVFNVVIRAHTRASWRIGESDTSDDVRLKLAHFLAHAHFLEKRVTRSLRYHAEGCRRAGRSEIADVVDRVLADEERHVGYTGEAIVELTRPGEREHVLAIHAEGEARADRAFSARQLRTFLSRWGASLPRVDRSFYAASALLLEL
ncbi:MAG: hypothetical protein U0234_14605 [Sandaracinus sp.]